MKIYFLGFAVREQDIRNIISSDANMPMQTHKFGWSFVDTLNIHFEVELVSSMPVSSYPGNKKLIFRGSRFIIKGLKARKLAFINIHFIKHITRFISSLSILFFKCFNIKDRMIVIHGIHSPYLLSGWMLKSVLGVKVVVIITDPPGVVLPSDGKLVQLMKLIDKKIITRLLNRFDASIVLSKFIPKDYMPSKPYLVIDGFYYDANAISFTPTPSNDDFTIIYAGGLVEEYGIDKLLDAVILLKDKNIKLKLFGKGEMESRIQKLASEYSCIEFFGYVEQDELSLHYSSANLLVNPRPTQQLFTRYSFPSKLIEYMASGIPVLTTKLPSIAEDYDDFLFYFDGENPVDMADKILQIKALPKAEVQKQADAAKDFILTNKTPKAYSKKIGDFLHSL